MPPEILNRAFLSRIQVWAHYDFSTRGKEAKKLTVSQGKAGIRRKLIPIFNFWRCHHDEGSLRLQVTPLSFWVVRSVFTCQGCEIKAITSWAKPILAGSNKAAAEEKALVFQHTSASVKPYLCKCDLSKQLTIDQEKDHLPWEDALFFADWSTPVRGNGDDIDLHTQKTIIVWGQRSQKLLCVLESLWCLFSLW